MCVAHRLETTLLDQQRCLPWLRDFAWGATYRRALAYQAFPIITVQGAFHQSEDGKRLAFWGSREDARIVELPAGRDVTPAWDLLRSDAASSGGTFHRSFALSPDGGTLAVGLTRLLEPFGGFGVWGQRAV